MSEPCSADTRWSWAFLSTVLYGIGNDVRARLAEASDDSPHSQHMTTDDPRTRDGVQYVQASPSLLKRLIRWVKAAGAERESDTPRNGFLSYHAESHAAGIGVSAGFIAMAFGEARVLGLVYSAAVYGRAHASNGKRARILRDIVHEPHYALFGVVVGALLGLASRVVAVQLGVDIPSVPSLAGVGEVMGGV